MTKVSVIVPNYNHERYLPARLDSIFAQTHSDYEVVLLDDCSTDGSLALLRRYAAHPRVACLLASEQNLGPFAQWQRGLSAATGDYVWIAESDDVAAPNFLTQLCAALDQRSAAGIAYCQSLVIDEQGRELFDNQVWTNDLDAALWQREFQLPGARVLRDFLLFKNVIPNASAVLFRRSLFEHVDRELARFRYVGDWLAWSQMLTGCELYFSPLPLNRFRHHAHSTRVGRRFEQSARYLHEVYRVIAPLTERADVDRAQRERAYDKLADRCYLELGARRLLDLRGLGLLLRLSRLDPLLAVRIARIAGYKLRRSLRSGSSSEARRPRANRS